MTRVFTEEQKERKKIYQRNYYARMTKKERKINRDKKCLEQRNRRARMTLDDLNKEHAYRMRYRMIRFARTRAKSLGVEFNLTLSDIQIPDRCPVFGMKLKRVRGRLTGASPTLDRIDVEKGYVRGNIAVISHFANRLKSNGSASQHRRIADWMDEAIRSS